jgi:hypothetical protein
MKLSRAYWIVWVLMTSLLFVGGLAVAQNSSPKAWGQTIDGLQMRVSLDQAGGQSKSPKFRIELQNTGEKALLLNLGIMARNGEQQYPTAVSLILVGARGESRLLELRSPQVSDAGRETLYLPLPIGATFSLPVDLDDYWAPTSKEFNMTPGTYSLAAHFNRVSRKREFRVQPIGGGSFDTVNPEAGGPPTSNTLQFEVPSR